MRIHGIVLTALLAAASGYAETGRLPDLPSLGQIQDELARKAEEDGRVWMRFTAQGKDVYEIEDGFLRIRVRADRRDDEFSLWGGAGEETVSLRLRPVFISRRDYTVTGSGADLTLANVMDPMHENRDYTLKGSLQEAGEKRKVDLTFTKEPHWPRYVIKDAARSGLVDLTLEPGSGWEIHGKVKLSRFGRKSLAAMSAAALAVIIHDDPQVRELWKAQARALEEVRRMPVRRAPQVVPMPVPAPAPALPPVPPVAQPQPGPCQHQCPAVIVNVHVTQPAAPHCCPYRVLPTLKPGRIIGWREFQRQHRRRP